MGVGVEVEVERGACRGWGCILVRWVGLSGGLAKGLR